MFSHTSYNASCIMYLMDSKGKNEIFVIDDDATIGDSISSLLMHKGYRVKTFTHGRDALRKAKERKPDLAIIDYLLPGESAEDIIRDFHTLGKDLPIVLMSASYLASKKAKDLPINEFIAKPFQIDLLLETIERNLN